MNQRNVPDPLLNKLSKSERRMYELLHRNGPTPTYVVRSRCSIGNPSETRRGINRKAKNLVTHAALRAPGSETLTNSVHLLNSASVRSKFYQAQPRVTSKTALNKRVSGRGASTVAPPRQDR